MEVKLCRIAKGLDLADQMIFDRTYLEEQLASQIGEVVAEKRGMRWALTPFARKAWKLTEVELQQEKEEDS